MTQTRDQALAEILAEAQELKTYRNKGVVYADKCENIVLRIKSALGEVKVENLTDADLSKIKVIKQLIAAEEIFAQFAADHRNPQSWILSKDD